MKRPTPDKSKRRTRIAYGLLGVASAFIVLGCAVTAHVPSDAEIPGDNAGSGARHARTVPRPDANPHPDAHAGTHAHALASPAERRRADERRH